MMRIWRFIRPGLPLAIGALAVSALLIAALAGLLCAQPTPNDAPRSNRQPGWLGDETGQNSQYVYIRVTLAPLGFLITDDSWDTAKMEYGSYAIREKCFTITNVGDEPLNFGFQVDSAINPASAFVTDYGAWHVDGRTLWNPDDDPSSLTRIGKFQLRAVVTSHRYFDVRNWTSDSTYTDSIGGVHTIHVAHTAPPPFSDEFRHARNLVDSVKNWASTQRYTLTDHRFLFPHADSLGLHVAPTGATDSTDRCYLWLQFLGPSSGDARHTSSTSDSTLYFAPLHVWARTDSPADTI